MSTEPHDEFGPRFTQRHWDLARTDPNRLTSEQWADLRAALVAAQARLDAREAAAQARRRAS